MLRDDGALSLELAPRSTGQRFVDRRHGFLELLVRRVEVRRDPDSRARPVIHEHISSEEILRHFVRVRNVDGHRAASPGRFPWRMNRVAAFVRELNEARRLPNALLSNGGDTCASKNLWSFRS